jgi:hypothetical protein
MPSQVCTKPRRRAVSVPVARTGWTGLRSWIGPVRASPQQMHEPGAARAQTRAGLLQGLDSGPTSIESDPAP